MKKEAKAKLKLAAVMAIAKARKEVSRIADAIDPEVPSSDNFVRKLDGFLKAGWDTLSGLGIDPMTGDPYPEEAGDEWRREVLSVITDEASGKAGSDEGSQD
jgi:hypothetical protein